MGFMSGLFSGLLYAIGGYDGQERLSTVEAFDPGKRQWKVVASMTCRRRLVTPPGWARGGGGVWYVTPPGWARGGGRVWYVTPPGWAGGVGSVW